MSKEMRGQIDKIKNFGEFLNENIKMRTLSSSLLDAIKDIAADTEYQYDKNLSYDVDKNIKIILNNNNLFKEILIQLKSDYKHDIELEKTTKSDYSYLLDTYNEIINLLKSM